MSSPVRPRTRALLEAVEPRILYSADLAAVAGMVGGDAALAHEVRLQTPTATAGAATASTAVAHEIAFVDLGVPDAQTLISGLQAQRSAGRTIEVVTLAADEDGLAVITRTLAERQAQGDSFAAVHVFSHGRAGEVQIGAATLDADSLLRRAGEIAGWGGALDAQADLMLYGCNVAADANGLFLIEGLAALTGADVAASDDLTGSVAQGGDWVLEQQTGPIDTRVAAEVALQQTWAGVLGNEIQVNTTTAGNQNTDAETRGSQQAVTLDAAGNFTVVWTSGGQDGGGKGVYVRRFAFDGTALTGEIQVNTTTAKDQQNARIVGDAAGNFAVVWTSQDQDGTTASVYFRRFAADGTALTGEIRANATDTGDQSNAAIAMNTGNGDVVVVWEGAGPTTGAVYFRRFAADGTALDAADCAVSTVGGEADPVVAMDATGRFVVAWGRAGHMYFQRYAATGASAGSAMQFDTFLSSSLEASIAMDSAGNFALAYGHTTTSNIKGIWCHAYFADGSSRGLWSNVDAATDAASASISLAADGSAVVVYQRAGDGAGNGIYARKIGPSGTVLGSDFLVNQSTDKEQVSASVAVHDTDRFVVVWSGDSAADKDGVYARTFEPVNSSPLITTNGGGSTAAVSVAENTTAVTTVGATDADWPVQTLAYTIIGGADQAKFSINPLSGALRFVAAPDFERPADADGNNVYEVVVQTNDGLLFGSAQTLSVTVTDANDQVTAVSDTASTPYVTPVTVAVLNNDQRGLDPTLTLLDVKQPAHGKATLTGGQVVYTPDTGFVGTDTFQYRVVDGSEGLTHYWSLDGAGAVDAITGVAGSPQGAPTGVAGVNGQALQFDGVDDHVVLPDTAYTNEFTLSYWFKLADNHGTGYRYLYSHAGFTAQNSLNIYFIEDATPAVSVQNVLRTSLIDSDDSTSLASRSELDIDATLLADGRWHQYTLTTRTGVGSSVYIDGGLRASSTQGGDAIDPTGNVYLGVDTALSLTRRLDGSLDDLQLLDHTTLASQVAAMSAGPGDTATVTVTVTPVNTETPVIVSDGGGLNAVLNVAENSTAVTVVSATDADVPTPTLTYSIIGGTDQALFAVDSLSGAVSFRAAQDFEHPASAGSSNTYEVIVQASDGVHADAQTLKVLVTDVNEYGVGPIMDQDAVADAVDENVAIGTTVGLTVQAVDPDGTGNTVTYALDDSAGGLFAIDSVSGVVKVAGALDAEAATSRNLIVRATSADGSSLTRTYTIAVRDLDEFDVTVPADANAAANTVREDAAVGTVVGLNVTATDADATSNTITYSLTNSAGGRFAIDATTGVVTVASALDAETALSHTIAVRATSADGSVSGRTFTIAVQDVNEFDIDSLSDIDPASATVREDAVVGTTVGVQAHAVDPDATNNTVTYSLSYNSSGRFSIDATSGVITVAGALNAESSLFHLLAVRATSSDGSSDTKWVTITVQDVDEFDVTTPVDQNSGANTVTNIASVGSTVGITASADDADVSLNQVTYTLDDDAGGRFAVGSSSGVVTLARSVTADADTVQTLVLRATSADGSVATQNFSVAITRANLYAPVITSDGGGATAALTVLENTTAVTTVIATDADVSPGARTYTITGGADAALFTIDPVSGVLRFAAAPDAEHPLDVGGDNVHEVTVLASDGVRFDTQTLTVTVADVNEAAVTTPVDADAAADSVLENAAIGTRVGVTASAVDADATNHSVTYTLDNSAGGRFAIDASTGVVTVAGLLDAETALSQTLVVRATSADGSTATQTWTVAVQDVNEFDVSAVTDRDAQADSVLENAPVGTLVGVSAWAIDQDATQSAVRYALTNDAGGRFVIDANTGVVITAQVLDAEAALSHTLTVEATSADGSTATRTWTVAVQDVNEFSVSAVTDRDAQADSVPENAPVGTLVGVSAWAIDQDATQSAVRYALTNDAGGRFVIDANTGVVTTAQVLDAEVALSHTLVVQATSADGSTATRTWTVAVADVNEAAVTTPVDADAAANSVLENAAIGTRVGVTASAIDADATNHGVTYTLDNSAGGRFAIDASTGVVTVAGLLDAETALGHTLVVRATSGDGSSATQTWTVAVQDVNEAAVTTPVDADAAADSVLENAAIGTRVGVTASAVDADATNHGVTYTLDNSAGGRFSIDASTGVVTTAQVLDAETALSHTLVVRATSVDGSTATQTWTLAVQDVNEAAVTAPVDADAAADSVLENAAIGTRVGVTASAVDTDATNHSVTYTLDNSAGGRFAIDASTGVVTTAQVLDAETALSHTLVVRATSADGSTATQTWTVAVQDVNEFSLSAVTDRDAQADSLLENTPVGTLVGVSAWAVDQDATQSAVRYALTNDAGGRFVIDANTGVVTTAQVLDAEAALSHTLTVEATSADGSTATRTWAVAVQDVDEFDLVAIDDLDAAPQVLPENAAIGTAIGVTAHSVDGDATNSTVTYALLDNAGGRFAIDATSGVITVAAALDAETAMSHTVVVQSASADGSLWTQAFTVLVTDVDEFDLVAVVDTDPAAEAVSENAAIGTRVGVTASAVDADATNHGVTYTLDDSAGGRFAVDATTGVVTLARSVQEEGVASRTLVLRATSADGSTVAASFTIAIDLVNDAAPVIESDGGGAAASVSVAEGQSSVTQVLARDTDLPTPALRYTLSGVDAAAFTLDATSGVLRFAAAPDAERPVDAGADNVYEVTVQVSDGERTDEQALRITVQPVNDVAPLIVSDGGAATALRHVAENSTLVTQVQARDADLPADTLVYALAGGADAALFTIDAATGELRWRAAPDYEAPRDVGADQQYDVVVSASDGLHVTTQALSVVVDNVDEAPRLDSSTLTVREGESARPVLAASDVDTPAARLVYTVQDVSGGWFESATAPGVAITRFTQADVDSGAIRFLTDGGERAPAYRLVLADDTWTLAPLAATVDFTPVNDAPVVAGVDLGAVDEDTPRVVTASELLARAGDAEGDALSVSNLRLAQGEGALVDLGGGRWRFEPAADWNGAVTLVGEVSDGQASVAVSASLQVTPVNDPPRIVSRDGATTVTLDLAENTTAVDTVQAADSEHTSPLHYAVVGGADAALFLIDANTGALTFRQAPDHEHPADANGDGRYEVMVEVSDGELRAQQALVVTVTNVDEPPVILSNTLVVSDGVVTLVLQASDPDTPATALNYVVDSVQGGQFERLSAPGKAVTQFTQAEIDAAQVVWVAAAGSGRSAYALRLSDGRSEVGIGAPTVQQQTADAVDMTLTVQSLAAGEPAAAPSAGEAATSAAALPSASTGQRGDLVPPGTGTDASAEAGLGLGQSVAAEPASARSAGVRPGEGSAEPVRVLAARVALAPVAEPAEVVFDLPSEGAEASRWLKTDLDLWASRSGSSLAAQIDRLRREVAETQQAGSVTLASTALVSTGLSVGYVVWLVRGGVLMTSLMSVVPAWAGMDPLPVLSEMRRAEGGAAAGDDDDDGGDDPIEKLFSKARRLLVRPVDGPAVTPAVTSAEAPGASA